MLRARPDVGILQEYDLRVDNDHCRPIADIEGQHVIVGPTEQQTWSASASAKTRLDSSGSGCRVSR